MNIAFAWSGLPDYAARCLRAVRARGFGDVSVVGTRPKVPIVGMEASLGAPVTWIEGAREDMVWADLGLPAPDVFFQGGYGTPAFRALGRDCRARGGKVICLSDVNWVGGFRQTMLDPLRHRFGLGKGFDGFFVAGASGLRWAQRAGYGRKPLRAGMYGADPVLFTPGPPLAQRPKRFVFVGRFEAVKNVLALIDAFETFRATESAWSLTLCGSGSLQASLRPVEGVTCREFLQPHELSSVLREHRCLVLPSLHEPWGLVVHEAALSGCALALAPRVGAADDLAASDNAVIFEGCGRGDILHGLRRIAGWSDAQWARAEAASLRLAAGFGPQVFADAVGGFLRDFEPAAP